MFEVMLGLFGGAGATLLWEGLIKPQRERRNIAEAIAAEVSLNLQLLAAAKLLASPTKIPPDFELSTTVFDGVVDKIGELSPQTLTEAVFLYRYFKQLSAFPKTYSESVDNIRSTPDDSVLKGQLYAECRTLVEVFNSYIEKAIVRANITQPLLLASARPWWSIRRLQQKPSELLTMDKIGERLSNAFQERANLAESIKQSLNKSASE